MFYSFRSMWFQEGKKKSEEFCSLKVSLRPTASGSSGHRRWEAHCHSFSSAAWVSPRALRQPSCGWHMLPVEDGGTITLCSSHLTMQLFQNRKCSRVRMEDHKILQKVPAPHDELESCWVPGSPSRHVIPLGSDSDSNQEWKLRILAEKDLTEVILYASVVR